MRFVSLLLVALSGCSVDLPVIVLVPRGDTLTGRVSATVVDGTFSVTNGRLTCGGHFRALDGRVFPVVATCSDGRKGAGVVTRNEDKRSGDGTLRMDDGEVLHIRYGAEVGGITPRVASD